MNSVGISNKRNTTKNIAILLLVAAFVFALSSCGGSNSQVSPQSTNPVAEDEAAQAQAEPSPSEAESHDEDVEADMPASEKIGDTSEETAEVIVPELKMKIDGQELTVIWEDNESVDALLALASDSPITVEMSMYGGFEQVGSLGTNLPRNDVQTTTQAGDIVLYSGNQIVVFYGSNSWAYTRLGHIDLTQQEMSDLLSHGDVTVTLE